MIDFRPSKPLTVGAEIEYQLVNAQNFDLADGIMPLLEFYPDDTCIKPEIVQETVEIASLPCEAVAELKSHLCELVADVVTTAAGLGLRLCGAGSHAFSKRLAAITPKPRYLDIANRSAYLAETRVTFATHIHIGVETPDEMIRIKRDLVPFLPMLLALSANSPFWHGCQTGFASYRYRALSAVSSYGIPPTFEDWAQFLGFFGAANRCGMCTEVKDLHWDIRPQPRFGTVEVRVMDAVSTIREVVALAALLRSLVAYLRDTPRDDRPPGFPDKLPWWAQRENQFRVSHSGLAAECIIDAEGHTERLSDTVAHVLEVLSPVARDLGEAHFLDHIRHVLEHPGYERQIDVYEQTGSAQQVTRMLADELSAEMRPRPRRRRENSR